MDSQEWRDSLVQDIRDGIIDYFQTRFVAIEAQVLASRRFAVRTYLNGYLAALLNTLNSYMADTKDDKSLSAQDKVVRTNNATQCHTFLTMHGLSFGATLMRSLQPEKDLYQVQVECKGYFERHGIFHPEILPVES